MAFLHVSKRLAGIGSAAALFVALLPNCQVAEDVAGDASEITAGARPHPNRNPQPKITECPNVIPSGPETCNVTRGTKGTLLRGTVLAPEEVLHAGEVLVDDHGMILCVGCDCSRHPASADASIVACANGVISPGLVNAHEHLTYQNNAPVGHGEQRYENRSDWQGARGHTRLDYKSGASSAVQAYAELRLAMSGVTTVAGSGGVPGLVRNIDTAPDELEGLPAGIARADVFPLGVPSMNIASGCDGYARRTKTSEIADASSYLVHVSEGIDAEAHNEFVCVSQGDDFNLVRPRTSVRHGIGLGAADAAKLAQGKARIIWSPRSNTDLYGNTAQAVMLDLAGVPIALGTDWVPFGSMNMLRELRCADFWNRTYLDQHFTDADLWRMATSNAASVVGGGDAVGMLARGYLADIAIYDGRTNSDFRAVLDAGVEDVALVLRGGKAIYGEAAVVNSGAFGPSCETLSGGVCGKSKAVCLDVELSSGERPSLDSIRTAGEANYPLFFCKDAAPTKEPSCRPSRSVSVRGSGVYDGRPTENDRDGDGIADALDNCPKIFNPIRPMDDSKQPDTDGDGIGDACDECPADASQQCAHAVSGDLDGDGVPNGLDNCPTNANRDQADRDRDGRGDACDACGSANPGATPCVLPISVVRDPQASAHPTPGTIVEVEGYVSARKSQQLLFLQEGTVGAPWQGIYVAGGGLVGTTTGGPKVGQRVKVRGVYGENFGVDQITAATIDVTDATDHTIVPLGLTAAQLGTAAAESFESLLVKVGSDEPGSLTITNDNPDAVATYEFVVTGGIRVDDLLFPFYGTPSPQSAACAPTSCPYPPASFVNGTSFRSITGILGSSFGTRKLYPRSVGQTAGDLAR